MKTLFKTLSVCIYPVVLFACAGSPQDVVTSAEDNKQVVTQGGLVSPRTVEAASSPVKKSAVPGVIEMEAVADAVGQSAPTRNHGLQHSVEKRKAESFIGQIVPTIRPVQPPIRIANEPLDRENYPHFDTNTVKRVVEQPVSTFSIDVDTASYANIRRILNQGRLPVADAIRVEELINYFSYKYPEPESREVPFSVITELGPNPWNPDTYLLHIGIQGYKETTENLPPSNLVFLIDVSGSMQSSNKLGLLKQSMKLLVDQLRAEDKVAIAVYAGSSGIVLEPTSGQYKSKMKRAIDQLTAGGSTNGAAGIRLAYQLAEDGFIEGGINRILLATDGDFNVGTVNLEALKDLVKEKRNGGVGLSVLSVGSGNYNDRLMEELSGIGDGSAYYIDSLREANKVLVEEVSASLLTIAKDTKIQIEFNPAVVNEYRLIGYENRVLQREDFNNDQVDAGDIGAGHTVTALYEIALADKGNRIDPLRYSKQSKQADSNNRYQQHNELAFLRLRFKQPGSDTSQLIERAIQRRDIRSNLASTSTEFRFAASIAAFGQVLRGGKYTGSFSLQDIHTLAQQNRGADVYGYRSEFLGLVRLANSLQSLSAR